ncbi:hypothetical protein OH77DRAFT_1439591 [Trametes cingulata]|nr:hypothetical protein OH77DRAFT_1439591 [Trametes cingulata]
MSRICTTTQNIPAPQGPRPRPPCPRNRTAPPVNSHKTRKDIPADKILDVLRNPAHYCEVYPETFPLTRKLVRQLQTQAAAHARAMEMVSVEAEVVDPLASGPLRELPGRPCFYERLPTAGDDIVPTAATGRHRELPPIGMELEATRRLGFTQPPVMATRMDEASIGGHSESRVRDGVERPQVLYGPGNVSVMDIVERGEWSRNELGGTFGYEMATGEAMVLSCDGTWTFQSSYTIFNTKTKQE